MREAACAPVSQMPTLCPILAQFLKMPLPHLPSAVFDTVDLFLPDVQFQTEASYIRLPPGARQALRVAGLPFREGVHAAAHALLNVLPLHLMCNPHDVGTGRSGRGGEDGGARGERRCGARELGGCQGGGRVLVCMAPSP